MSFLCLVRRKKKYEGIVMLDKISFILIATTVTDPRCLIIGIKIRLNIAKIANNMRICSLYLPRNR